jgi:hypothetical protein
LSVSDAIVVVVGFRATVGVLEAIVIFLLAGAGVHVV